MKDKSVKVPLNSPPVTDMGKRLGFLRVLSESINTRGLLISQYVMTPTRLFYYDRTNDRLTLVIQDEQQIKRIDAYFARFSAEYVIDDLSGAQIRNIEAITGQPTPRDEILQERLEHGQLVSAIKEILKRGNLIQRVEDCFMKDSDGKIDSDATIMKISALMDTLCNVNVVRKETSIISNQALLTAAIISAITRLYIASLDSPKFSVHDDETVSDHSDDGSENILRTVHRAVEEHVLAREALMRENAKSVFDSVVEVAEDFEKFVKLGKIGQGSAADTARKKRKDRRKAWVNEWVTAFDKEMYHDLNEYFDVIRDIEQGHLLPATASARILAMKSKLHHLDKSPRLYSDWVHEVRRESVAMIATMLFVKRKSVENRPLVSKEKYRQVDILFKLLHEEEITHDLIEDAFAGIVNQQGLEVQRIYHSSLASFKRMEWSNLSEGASETVGALGREISAPFVKAYRSRDPRVLLKKSALGLFYIGALGRTFALDLARNAIHGPADALIKGGFTLSELGAAIYYSMLSADYTESLGPLPISMTSDEDMQIENLRLANEHFRSCTYNFRQSLGGVATSVGVALMIASLVAAGGMAAPAHALSQLLFVGASEGIQQTLENTHKAIDAAIDSGDALYATVQGMDYISTVHKEEMRGYMALINQIVTSQYISHRVKDRMEKDMPDDSVSNRLGDIPVSKTDKKDTQLKKEYYSPIPPVVEEEESQLLIERAYGDYFRIMHKEFRCCIADISESVIYATQCMDQAEMPRVLMFQQINIPRSIKTAIRRIHNVEEMLGRAEYLSECLGDPVIDEELANLKTKYMNFFEKADDFMEHYDVVLPVPVLSKENGLSLMEPVDEEEEHMPDATRLNPTRR